MKTPDKLSISPATPEDAEALAKLIDIAGEGIPSWLWARSAKPAQSPLDIGMMRAQRENGGFSYKNAIVARFGATVAGMVLSYPIEQPSEEDLDSLPAAIVPFVALEKHAIGTWYVNALAVLPAFQGQGIGAQLLEASEKRAAKARYVQMSIQVYAQNARAVGLYRRMGYSIAHSEAVRNHPCHPYYTGDVLFLLKDN